MDVYEYNGNIPQLQNLMKYSIFKSFFLTFLMYVCFLGTFAHMPCYDFRTAAAVVAVVVVGFYCGNFILAVIVDISAKDSV